MEVAVDEVLQVYVPAPLAVKVAEPPWHTEVGVAVMLTVGAGFTTKVTKVNELHPPLLPVTVYTVVTVGETKTLVPDKAPGVQK